METALYSPMVRVPRSSWFTQVLLYWDHVATIVPPAVERDEHGIDAYTRELASHGLVEFVEPSRELGTAWKQFHKGFIDVLDGAAKKQLTGRFSRVHLDKLNGALLEELSDRGLAHPGPGSNWGWWEVESRTADDYMVYLASAISAARSDTVMVTDGKQSLGTISQQSGTLRQRLGELRFTLIRSALPTPAGTVPVSELKAFKQDHADELLECRAHLDKRLREIVREPDAEMREVMAKEVAVETKRQVRLLRTSMERRDWPRVTAASFGAVLGGASVVAGSGGPLEVGLGVGGAIFELATVYDAARSMARPTHASAEVPLVYAALASAIK